MTNLRWVSWAAVSSLPQAKKVSIEDQLQINREHCARHGGHLVAELIVPGESRSIVLFEDAARRIEAYARLKELIDNRAFDVLVYLDSSRLGRIDALVVAVRALCRQAGIIAYETDSPPSSLELNDSYDDMLLGAIKAVGAEREVRKMAARNASGMLGRAKAGYVPGQMVYGYNIRWQHDDNRAVPTYIIDPLAAAVVRRIFDLYLSGKGTPSIARALSASEIPSPSGRGAWTRDMVVGVVGHAWRYAGYVEINVESKAMVKRPYYRTRGNWQPIIDEPTLHRILAERKARTDNRKLADARHLLTGVCICGICNRPMSLHRATNWGRPSDYVRCHSHTPTTTARTVDIIDVLRALFVDLPNRDLDSLIAIDTGNGPAIDAQLQQQAHALSQLARARERTHSAYVDGHMDAAEYASQIKRLRTQETQATAEIERLEALAAIEAQRFTRRQRLDEIIADGLAMLSLPDVTAANIWLREHLRVYIAGKAISIEWL